MFSANLMQAIVNYLETKPFKEVAPLINSIMQENEAAMKVAQEPMKAEAIPVAATTALTEQDQKAMGEPAPAADAAS